MLQARLKPKSASSLSHGSILILFLNRFRIPIADTTPAVGSEMALVNKHFWFIYYYTLSQVLFTTPAAVSDSDHRRQNVGMSIANFTSEDCQWRSRHRLDRQERVLERFHCFKWFEHQHIHRYNQKMHGKETISGLSEFDSNIDSLCCSLWCRKQFSIATGHITDSPALCWSLGRRKCNICQIWMTF